MCIYIYIYNQGSLVEDAAEEPGAVPGRAEGEVEHALGGNICLTLLL